VYLLVRSIVRAAFWLAAGLAMCVFVSLG